MEKGIGFMHGLRGSELVEAEKEGHLIAVFFVSIVFLLWNTAQLYVNGFIVI